MRARVRRARLELGANDRAPSLREGCAVFDLLFETRVEILAHLLRSVEPALAADRPFK
jgi:hypothetical protein